MKTTRIAVLVLGLAAALAGYGAAAQDAERTL